MSDEIVEQIVNKEINKHKKEDDRGTLFWFTDYNPHNHENGYEWLYNEYKDIIRGIGWETETGKKCGKVHNQGFFQLFEQGRFKPWIKRFKLKNEDSDKGAWMGKCNGSIEDNERYCSKDGAYTMLGYFCNKAYRSDFHNIKDDLREGASLYKICDNYTSQYIRYPNGIKCMAELIRKDKRNNLGINPPKTFICKGKNIDIMKYLYTKHEKDMFCIEATDKDRFIFDGYDNEKILVIQNFECGHVIEECEDVKCIMGDNNINIRKTKLEEIVEGIPQRLKIKGSTTYDNWEFVYLCSKLSKTKWYYGSTTFLDKLPILEDLSISV